MRRLGPLTANLARNRKRWESLVDGSPAPDRGMSSARDGLRELVDFGSNPGNLRGFAYVPEALDLSPALVVVLHGCTQTAAEYDRGSGWSTLADRYGFAVLFPEQQPANNPKTCFSWFQPGDTTRGRGEALSVRQMVDRMVRDHGIARSRVFVTGLSAGGAMAAALLASYPDVFAGGAILAGLPYGAAASVQEALESMFNGRTRPAREWGDLVRAASGHGGPWPRVSVWHGSADTTVAPVNARELVKQWTDVHGLARTRPHADQVDGYPRRVWRGPSGEILVEEYTITGMAHGIPLAPNAAEGAHGEIGPFLLDAGIASSYRIAAFFGLTDGIVEPVRPARTGAETESRKPAAARPSPAAPSGGGSSLSQDVQSAIADALRSAGLLR